MVRKIILTGLCSILVLLTCIAGYLRLRGGTIEKDKAEAFGLANDPLTIAEAVLAYIESTGVPPRSVDDCIVLASEQPPHAFDKYGQLWIELPYGQNVVVKSVVDRIVLTFPPCPEELTIRDGVLVRKEDQREAMLLSIPGSKAEIANLRRVNNFLWENWSLLARGKPTGIDWLEVATQPASPTTKPDSE